ncbi:carboxypeptidase M32 [bacterium]|nr:carboxypeptidase M32 [bacterium]
MKPREAYDWLAELSRERHVVGGIGALVGWDQEVNMPPKGAPHRARMRAWMAGQHHRLATLPRIGEALAAAEGRAWGAGEAANLREWRREHELATKLPTSLVERQAKAASQGNEAWKKARAADDFGLFQPCLGELIQIARERAECLGYIDEPYDALLDIYQAGLSTAGVGAVFGDLRQRLVPLLERILDWQGEVGPDPIQGEYPESEQRAFNIEGAELIGFDFAAGRLDVAAHPFCSGTCRGDVRLTTRYNPADPLPSHFGTLHEAGHGVYEQGLSEEHEGTPLGGSVSLSIHESQSIFFESMVGQDPAYWEHMLGPYKAAFPGRADGVTHEQMVRRVNRVGRTLIRVEADEVTYPLHVILRFEMERDLFRGDIGLADLPGVWMEKMDGLVGAKPRSDADGVLQDIHWSMGGFGYFPSYAMGRMNAAQLGAALTREHPGWRAGLARGDCATPLAWMRTNIHGKGMLLRTDELMEDATGVPPLADDYLAYLESKYRAIFA